MIAPICLKNIVKWLKDPTAEGYLGYMWALLLTVVLLIKSYFIVAGNAYLAETVCLMLINMRNLIRWKVSRLSPAARKYVDFGQISSLVTVDCYRFDDCFMRGYHLGTAPSICLFLIVYLTLEIGWVGLLSPGLMILMIVAQKFINDFNNRFNRKKLT